jgi:hypothetical protein
MTAILKVDTIQDTSGNNIINENSNTITIGASGDTINVPSGATFNINGTAGTGVGISGWSSSSGSLLPASASAGIYLGVNSATAANLLDDYEEGTFTPQLKISGSTTGITYSVQAGHYTKIGNRAIVNMEIALSAKGSNTGNVSLIGLPFTTSNDNYQTAYVYNDRVSSPNGDVQAYVLSNNTNINFYQSRTDGTNNGNLTGNELNSNSYLIMFATYKTA